jgi:hypothetical protein
VRQNNWDYPQAKTNESSQTKGSGDDEWEWIKMRGEWIQGEC